MTQSVGEDEFSPGDGRPRFVVVSPDLEDLIRFRSNLLRQLVASGYCVIVLTPDGEASSVDAVETLGAHHHRVGLNRTGTNPLQDFKSLVEMFRLFRDIEPAAVFTEGAKPIVVGMAAAWLLRIRRRYAMLPGLGYAFVEDGGASLRRKVVRLSQVIAYRILFAGCRAVIFHNKDDMLLFRKLAVIDESKAWVVPGSGIDLELFPATEPPVNPVKFLFLGRLLHSKGVVELLDAARLLRNECPTAEVHLAGAADSNPESVDRAVLSQHEASGNVVLHGRIADVRPLLREASVFVLPSYREGLPRSALEALASGRTVIVTDVPGCREVAQEGEFGTLVPVRDSASLAQAMIDYASNPERIVREGRSARLAAEERFDVHLVTAAMLDALEVSTK